MAERQTHYDVFLSHNSCDKPCVEPLAIALRDKGFHPFLDQWNLVPGEPIEEALIEALDNSGSAVIFVGPGGDGPWQSEEMRDILKRAVKSRNEFRAIPVLLPDASPQALEKSFLGNRLWIQFTDVDDDDALLRLAKAIQGEAYGDESFRLPDEPAPYRGLERFERIENPQEDFFFGRDDEVRALVDRLVRERFVAVVGASGSGKSSLIRAGLTKQLAEEIHPGIRRWQTITVEPGSDPFRSLAVRVAVAAGIPPAERESWIETSVNKWSAATDGVRLSLQALFADASDPLLVFIDQFEELFTHRDGRDHEKTNRNFVANLDDLWRHGGDRVRVIVALRADFVEQCLEIGRLKELLQDRTMLVGEVGDDALREIVKEPAARVGAFLEKGLMERILTEVRSQSGSLPLLQQALHELWRNRKGAWLTHDAYNASGGVARALNDQAQAAYKSLDDDQKRIADSLFPRLITLGEGVSDTRRRVKREELYPQGVEPEAVNEVIRKLSGKNTRILVTSRQGSTEKDLGMGEDFVEFTHEALLGNWEHLVRLLDTERESIRKHRILTTAAEEWESKPPAEKQKFLLHAGRLLIAEQWAHEQGGYARLNQLERRYLDESTRQHEAEQAHKAKIARRLKVLSIGATAAAVVALVLGGLAFQQKEEITRKRDQSLNLQSHFLADAAARQLSQGDAVTAAMLALEGLQDPKSTDATQRIRPYVQEAYFSLQSAWRARREQAIFAGHTDHVTDVSFSRDGNRIVTASEDKTARSWDVATGKEIQTFRGHQNRVWGAVFSPDGDRVVTTSEDHTVRVWDSATGTAIRVLKGHQGTVWNAGFSTDGKRLVTVSDDKTARLWDAENWEAIKAFQHDDAVYAASFSFDGKTVATACGDDKACVWDIESGEVSVTLSGHSDEVYRAVFSPDADRMVTTSRDKTARIWDVKGHPLHILKGHLDAVDGAAFSPDGTRVLTASQDGTARLWDVVSGKKIQTFSGHGGGLNAAAFSPDATLIVTASDDNTARIWDATSINTLSGHTDVVWSAVFSPDGNRILTASQDGTARFWDAMTGKGVQTLDGPASAAINDADFSPDGTRVVTASVDETARIWDAETLQQLLILRGHDNWVYQAQFSLDGTRVVTAAADNTVRLWDAKTGTLMQTLSGHNGWVNAAAFSPDSTRIVTASHDKTAGVWDAATGKLIHSLRGHSGPVHDAVFSPDGTRVATASADKTARIWDATSGKQIRILAGHRDKLLSAEFAPDGEHIVTASHDRTARIWGAATGRTVKVLQGHEAEVLHASFGPDGIRVLTASADGTARDWHVNVVERQTLIEEARKQTPRCLTPQQRTQFFLPPEPPNWCIEMRKWPYHTDAWQRWLADKQAGKQVEMPTEEG